MNIVQMIGTGIWTGAEQHVHYLCRGLLAVGQDVTIVARKGTVVGDKFAADFPAHTVLLPLKNSIDIKSIIKLAYLINKKQIDIIHTHHNKIGWLAVLASKLAGRGKVLNTRHMVQHYGKNDFLHRWYNKQLVATICPSQAVKQSFLQFNPTVSADKVYVVYNGIDIAALNRPAKDLRCEFKISESASVLGFVGRISPDKGIEYLVEALGILQKNESTNFKLLIAGDDEHGYRQVIEKRLAELDITDKVVFLGYYRDMASFMQSIDFLVLPSPNFESFGQVACEAMACAKPVVATTVGALPEVIQDDKTGILVRPHSAEELVLAIKRFIKDKAFRKISGNNANVWVEESFSVVTMAKNMMNCYEEVAN